MAHSSPASIHVLTLTDVDCPCEQQPHHCGLRALSLSAPGPNYPNFQSMLLDKGSLFSDFFLQNRCRTKNGLSPADIDRG